MGFAAWELLQHRVQFHMPGSQVQVPLKQTLSTPEKGPFSLLEGLSSI